MIWIGLEKKSQKTVKNTWCDWLINYIPEPIRKSVGGFKDKIVSLFQTNTSKQTVYGRGKKLWKPKKQNIKKPFISEKNKEKTKDRIIRDIRALFEQEENYYEPKRVSSFWNNIYIKYENNGDKNSNLSLDKYLNKIKPYLRNIIIYIQYSDTWKI